MQVGNQLTNIFKYGYRRNAFSVLVWFEILVLSFIIPAMLWTDDLVIKYTLLVVVCLLILFGITCYFFMLLSRPYLLQSEQYRLEEYKLDLIKEKGGDIPMESVKMTTPHYIIGEEN